jgi:hypothetical protein
MSLSNCSSTVTVAAGEALRQTVSSSVCIAGRAESVPLESANMLLVTCCADGVSMCLCVQGCSRQECSSAELSMLSVLSRTRCAVYFNHSQLVNLS